MKNFKITEAMSMEDQENIIKNIKEFQYKYRLI